MALWTKQFKDHYLQSLQDYKSFYDDVHEYGNPDKAQRAFYFIPGFNGVAGQIRFAIPSFTARYGCNFYIRSLHLDEFSAHKPTWDKYNAENIDKKHQKIIVDLSELSERFDNISIIASSSGFYDFIAVADQIPESVMAKLRLAWVACAPDCSERSVWEPVFYRMNGFDYHSDQWFAYPNHNWIKCINRECSANKKWQYGRQKKIFYKYDLESRFYLGGVLWAYVSITRYNWIIQYNIEKAGFPIDTPCVVLVAEKDGYWYGKSKQEIQTVINRYLSSSKTLFRNTTHLWVTVPQNITAVLEEVDNLPVNKC